MSGLVEMLIGKRLTPEEQVKKWRSEIRSQERELDKTLRGIEQEQVKAKKLIKQAAKRNDIASCKMMAREIVNSNKAKSRIITSKAQLNSLIMNMQQQLAVAKVTGALEKSTDIMKIMNSLTKLPELAATTQAMSMEMMKAGVIEEMITDTLELDDDEIEEEAQGEVDKVLHELTDGLLGEGGAVGSELPAAVQAAAPSKNRANDEMEARLKALNSV